MDEEEILKFMNEGGMNEEEASSKSAKEIIGKLIISNYRQIVEMKEGK